ncbi:hypothetical protein M501DRAFT_992311 [Patellaria atrata CBS 101060]|uniref:DUF7689 domain-containing protein n=1 Tax=Patellaria atrata CBS 101060 TaxID=1346257 RepID=A0A9P4SAY6_9PEZI|nr:hypothetical protein M501DRAFT_992311 [Patellaria atrata CBS 101060]
MQTPPKGEALALNNELMTKEWGRINPSDFPNLHREHCTLTDYHIDTYNCIAWSVGEKQFWISPPKTRDEFVKLYEIFGAEEIKKKDDPRVFAAGYLKNGVPTHAARVYNELWESKFGEGPRLTHPPTGLDGSNSYGSATIYFSTPYDPAGKLNQLRELVANRKPKTDLTPIRQNLEQHCQPLFKAFDDHLKAWEAACKKMSKDTLPAEYAQIQECNPLLALGPKILPLLVEKFPSGDFGFAAGLYDKLQSDHRYTVPADRVDIKCTLKAESLKIVDLYVEDFFNVIVRTALQNFEKPKKPFANRQELLKSNEFLDIAQQGWKVIPFMLDSYIKQHREGKASLWHIVLEEFNNPKGQTDKPIAASTKADFDKWIDWFNKVTPQQWSDGDHKLYEKYQNDI